MKNLKIFDEDFLNEKKGIIGDNGVQKIKSINLVPNVFVYFGASTSPSRIYITKIKDDMIFYKSNDDNYSKERKIDKEIGEDLISRGSFMFIKTRGKFLPETKKKLEAILSGKKVKKDNIDDGINMFYNIEFDSTKVNGDELGKTLEKDFPKDISVLGWGDESLELSSSKGFKKELSNIGKKMSFKITSSKLQ